MNFLTRAGVTATVALLATTAAAAAADIPGNNSTRATLRVQTQRISGVFEAGRDSDWYRVNLTRGQDYAASFGSGIEEADVRLNLRDPSGRVVRSIPGDPYGDRGFEYRAPRTGTYFVEAVVGVLGPDEPAPLSYSLAVAPDCRDDATTQCALRLGRPQQRQSLTPADWDRYRVALDSRQRYTFRVAGIQGNGQDLSVQVIDGSGRVLATNEFGGELVEIAGFGPPRSGTYFLRVLFSDGDSGGTYTASVAAE